MKTRQSNAVAHRLGAFLGALGGAPASEQAATRHRQLEQSLLRNDPRFEFGRGGVDRLSIRYLTDR